MAAGMPPHKPKVHAEGQFTEVVARLLWQARAYLHHPLSRKGRRAWYASHPLHGRDGTVSSKSATRKIGAGSKPASAGEVLRIDGFCPICESAATFVADGPWLRGTLKCRSCEKGSVPRERALAAVLNRECPDWRTLSIHESSPMQRGISLKLQRQAKHYVGSHFFPEEPFGTIVKGWRNENIEQQTFESDTFDLVITLDVTEHVFHPDRMFKEIWRTLKPGGLYISTFPIRKRLVEATVPLARLHPDGTVEFLKDPPEYHGNPIDGAGALVTWDYGYDIHQQIAEWAPFDVEITRFADRHQGIIGEYTEVVVCRKR